MSQMPEPCPTPASPLLPVAPCGHAHACAHGSLAEHREARDAICIDRVSFTYPGQARPTPPGSTPAPGNISDALPGNGGRLGFQALREVTLHVERGCNLGIIGPNGAGKSTLLKIIMGLLEGYTGSVSIMGMSPRDACRRGNVIGYIPQRHDINWRFPVSARQVVQMGLVGKTGLFRRIARSDRDYADHLMRQVGILDLAHRPIGDLSGGQQQRLFIARALVARPPILVFDEPLVGVDETGQEQFAQLIHQLHESLGLTVILVSHDLQAIAAGCNRVACLNQSIHYHDAPGGLTEQVLREVFAHDLVPSTRRSQRWQLSPVPDALPSSNPAEPRP